MDKILQEEYRFTFIRYLEIADELNGLEKDRHCVLNMQSIYQTGRSIADPTLGALQERSALEAEKVLFRRYQMERTEEGFTTASQQFFAELVVAKNQEEAMWDILLTITKKANLAWFQNDARLHHKLFLESSERIRYYLVKLQNFGKDPMPPETLESMFRINYGSLIDTVNFRAL